MTLFTASYWRVFRVIFVVFSLYLLGDAFFRWDGFRYYASFPEFLPAVALATILWTLVAMIAAFLIWLPGRILEWFCRRLGCGIRTEHLLLWVCISVLLGAAVWLGKRLLWEGLVTTLQLKLGLFLCVVLAAIFLTWLFRNSMTVIQERITPLVWLFSIWFLLSVPLVAYTAWVKGAEHPVPQKVRQSAVRGGDRPNIILVTFDTLTARDMSVYGYKRPTTPFISKWAESASLFTRTYSGSNFTTPTTATLMTGKRVWTHRTYHLKGSKPLKNDIENLPLMLRKEGYYNMAFIVNPKASVKTLGVSESFDIAPLPTEFSTAVSLFEIINKFLYRSFGDKIALHDWIIKEDFILRRLVDMISQDFSITLVPPGNAFKRFFETIDNTPDRPFFAWIHLMPPHYPYLPPEPYMGMFDPSPKMRTYKSQWEIYTDHSPAKMRPGINTFRARYDEFIRYSDKEFENFIMQLTAKDNLKNTAIIFSSDHGESFEHNYVGHNGPHLYEQFTHIPLVIKRPGQTEGRVINDPVEQIDIPATILDIAGIRVPSWMEGRSLLPLTKGEKLPPRHVFSMNFEKNPSRGQQITSGTIALWEGDYKLIHYLEKNKSLLFNLKDDPDELNNLFDSEPERGRRMLGVILDNLGEVNEKISRGE